MQTHSGLAAAMVKALMALGRCSGALAGFPSISKMRERANKGCRGVKGSMSGVQTAQRRGKRFFQPGPVRQRATSKV